MLHIANHPHRFYAKDQDGVEREITLNSMGWFWFANRLKSQDLEDLLRQIPEDNKRVAAAMQAEKDKRDRVKHLENATDLPKAWLMPLNAGDDWVEVSIRGSRSNDDSIILIVNDGHKEQVPVHRLVLASEYNRIEYSGIIREWQDLTDKLDSLQTFDNFVRAHHTKSSELGAILCTYVPERNVFTFTVHGDTFETPPPLRPGVEKVLQDLVAFTRPYAMWVDKDEEIHVGTLHEAAAARRGAFKIFATRVEAESAAVDARRLNTLSDQAGDWFLAHRFAMANA